jgi:hypothetical protein
MLPSLGRLSLTRTGGSLAPGQSPEDVTCVICFHSLAAPPPDGENVWPFDDDPVIWIVACNNQHAFHKGCLRAYARDSEDPNRCPECRVPMMPQVLTHVSRPSSGEHAAREAREAEERAEGQQRDAEDARRRERENLEQMQREFQEMDEEDRRMHAGAYGEFTLTSDEEEEWDSEREQQAELDAMDEDADPEDRFVDYTRRRNIVPVPDWSEIAPRLRSYSASDNFEIVAELEDMISRGPRMGDRSARAYYNLTGVIGACIARGSIATGRDEYRNSMINELSLHRAWLLNVIVACSDSICPPAVKGQLLRLLAAYADDPRVQTLLRGMNAQQRGRTSWDAAGAFAQAIRGYLAHLRQLDPPTNSSYTDEESFERNTNDSRRIDALRVLHHLMWDPIVRDEWLLPYNGRGIVDDEYDDDRVREALERERFVPEARELVDELVTDLGTLGNSYDEATEPLVYETVKAHLRALLAIFRVWHGRYSGFDEYDLTSEDPVIPFPFGEEVVRLWGLANYMHGVWEWQHEEEPAQGHIQLEKLERYDQMREMLTRLVWLGVTWWIGRPYPQNNDSATPDEMEHFFWAYVAPWYDEDDDSGLIFKYEDLTDLAIVINRNNMMRDQWIGDRRSGPWFHNLGMDNAERGAERAERQAQRARDGGETPDARRQRRD